MVYVGVVLHSRQDSVRSQTGVGVAGVVLVAVTAAAGLGFCALLGIAFNATTTQIIPFLALGLGVDSMLHLLHTYADNDCDGRLDVSIFFCFDVFLGVVKVFPFLLYHPPGFLAVILKTLLIVF